MSLSYIIQSSFAILKSDYVEHKKVTFVNRYGITLAADMYSSKDAKEKLPAIAVSGPFGAVKEQCFGLYAQTMAAVDFLSVQNNVDAEKIGIIGIYSWGGMALNVAILKGKWRRLVRHGKKRSISN